MSRELQKRMSIIIGSFLVIVMGATAILPAISNPTQTQTVEATPLPSPEPFPPVLANDLLDFSARYLHPSALYTIPIPQPIQWNQVLPTNESSLARTTLRSDLYVLEVYVQNAPGLTPEELPSQFTSAILERTWRNYQQAERRGPGEMRGDRFYVDYDLTLNRRLFNARHLAWTDGNRLYVIRVVGPSNAIEQTIFLVEQMAAELETIAQFQDGDAGWTGSFDPENGYVIRYPTSWVIQDHVPGRPLSISIDDRTKLKINSLQEENLSEDRAVSLFNEAYPNAKITYRSEWEAGFFISFRFETALGEEQSGAWLVLPNEVGNALLAELLVEELNFDLMSYDSMNADGSEDEADPVSGVYSDVLEVLRTLQPVSWDYITQDVLETNEDGFIVLPVSE